MTTNRNALPLRPILMLDAAACIVMGLGFVALAGPIGALTDLPVGFTRIAGLLLLPVAAFILLVATRREIPAAGVAVVVIGNVGWVLASLAVALGGLVEANAAGTALIVVQAAAVAAIAALEHAARPGRSTLSSAA